MTSEHSTADKYKAAGVDIDAGNRAAARYQGLAAATARTGVLGSIGGFAGGFEVDMEKYPQPVLLSGTDGVGTKLKLAFTLDKHDTIGIDCVAMCVNDILTSGATPLFFLDYLAVEQLQVEKAALVVGGVAAGCGQANCALVGGETAEMPDMYAAGEYDLAGFAVGVVNKPDIIDGSRILPGDIVLGLASSGAHSNGYSLIRKVLADREVSYADTLPGWDATVGEVLLTPTRIYVSAIQQVIAKKLPIHGMAHITGGGLLENVPRCLPDGCSAEIDLTSWPIPTMFHTLAEFAEMSIVDASRIWNLGIGYVVVVPADHADSITRVLEAAGETVHHIGRITSGDKAVTYVGDEKFR